jgi:putative (di)nucleoside polyphosphate hydrolase
VAEVGAATFRAGVVAVVVAAGGRHVLAFERADTPGSWQLPQGGIGDDEEPLAAAWRELGEETGLGEGDLELIGLAEDWTVYAYPAGVGRGRHRGQVQRWCWFRARHPDVEPRPDGRELAAWRWVEPAWLVEHIVWWRRPAYVAGFAAAPAGVLA